MCDFNTLLVPCAMVPSFRQHISSLGQWGQDRWQGITTWAITVTATVGNQTGIWRFRNIRAGLFAFKSRRFSDGEFTLKDFTASNALRIAAGLPYEPVGSSAAPTLKINPQNSGSQEGKLTASGQTACKVMADVAQSEAEDALRGGTDPKTALGIFDREFSTLYHGGPLTSVGEAQKWRHGEGREINRFYASNASGFQDRYRDTGTEPHPVGGYHAEQTHHFSAYLSLGINRMVHVYYYGLRGDNAGDQRLSEAAFNYGLRLRNHPGEISKVGEWIRKNICTNEGHGLYRDR